MNRRRRLRPRALPILLCLSAAACRHAGEVVGLERPATPPLRIVAGSVFAAEVLFAIVPRERIVGVHEFVADPVYSLVADQVAGLPQLGASPEELLALRPDLVIVDAFTRPETLAVLASVGVPVLCPPMPHDFDGIAANLRAIGRACHREAEAETLVGTMNAQLAAIRERGRELAAWRLCRSDGGLHTYGRGSLFDAMIGAVGATNLAAERGVGPFRKLSNEALLSWRPDAIVVPSSSPKDRLWLEQVPGLSLLPCQQRGHLVFVPGPALDTTSHHLVATAARVQEQLLAWGRP